MGRTDSGSIRVGRVQIEPRKRLARYGLGPQTLIDTAGARHVGVPGSRVQIDRRRWNKTLVPVLDGLRAELGLPDGCRLRVQLHSV